MSDPISRIRRSEGWNDKRDVIRAFKDWWRGYKAEDIESMREKLKIPRDPGQLVELTTAEFNALMGER